VLSDVSLLIVEAWVVIGLTLIGMGLLWHWLCRAPATSAGELLHAFWLGWALLLFLLQFWHFFLPVDERAAVAAVAVGLIGIAVGGWRPWGALLRGLPWHLPTLMAFALLVLGLSNRALDGPHFGDVGLYHLPVVYWDKAYPIVPGLGNLFVPFGHNISYFLWVALLDVGPFAHCSLHLANSILVLALFARGLLGLDRLVRVWRPCAPHDVYWALVLPIAVGQAFSIFFTSPSPDQPVVLIELALAGELVAFFGRRAARPAPDFDVLAVALLAAAAVTIKLSAAGLAAAVVLVVVVRWLWRDRPLRHGGGATLVALATVAVAAAVIWVTGNLVLTGCPVYPSGFAALPVDWRVQADAVKWIEAPMVFGLPLWQAIVDWRWSLRRLDSLGWNDPFILVPLALCLVTTAITVCYRCVRRRPEVARLPLVILVPALVSFVFCFANTPMPRYLGASVWILLVDSLLLFLGATAYGHGRWGRALTGVAVLAATGFVLRAQDPLLLSARSFAVLPAPQVVEETLPTGLRVRVPRESQTCWDAPPPCTPEPNPGLRLRRAGDLASGFWIAPSISPGP